MRCAMRLLALCVLSIPAVALAADPPPDCATLTDDAKTTCELNLQLTTARADLVALGDCAAAAADAKPTCDAKKVELDQQIAALVAKLEPPKDTKGGKATRSNTNRMEAEAEDE